MPLPSYPWQRQRYWVSRPSHRPAGGGYPLLGEPVNPAALPGTRIWQRDRRGESYLAEHRVDSAGVLPATA
ncbi:hypothetical protein GCM10023321_50750 [Pseudonocardia eucalypti]|uniref:Uncharacterized protein n=1 Tax=Pseudonocardia eucalypti TaxID=648755 RepID=A0ABP9QLA1_9PSEU|nr:acyl transferase domain-containing protein [Pseudonocardia eucalypti]